MHRVAAVLALVPVVAGSAASTEWLLDDYNPLPSEADVILPVPCDGSMIFLPVVTDEIANETDRLYSDTTVWLGWGGARETAFQEAEWREYVSGGLTDGDNRYYLIAKYEVTADQYTAVMDRPCEADSGDDALPSEDAGLPATQLSWFDAVAFGDAYTRWLYDTHPDLLPTTFGGGAFVRLPSEAEWEYAVRGGNAVSKTERRNERFPLDGQIGDYGWYSGPESSRGEVQFIGLLKPNPLGLYDVYGNVGEVVLEGFRANKAGRLHGQVGAATIKGGSFLSAPETLRSGGRREMAHYSDEIGGTIKRRDVGFRPVITGLVTGDLAHAQGMSANWAALGDIETDDGSVVDRLRSIADETADLSLRAALNEAATAIGSEIRAREEREREALENLVLSASVMASRLHVLHFRIERMRNLFGADEITSLANPNREEREARALYEESLLEFGIYAEVYSDAFLRVVDQHEAAEVVSIARQQVAQHQDRNRQLLQTATSAFGIQVREYDASSGWDREKVLVDLMTTLQNAPRRPEWFDEALRN